MPEGYGQVAGEDPVTLHVEPVLGINSKVAAYVWLNGGLGMEISKTYRLAELDDSEDSEAEASTVWLGEDSSELTFHPQAGLRLLVGNLTLGASMIMDGLDPESLFENPEFSLQGGIAF